MGLHRIEIKFEQTIPSFQNISLQYERQTGLSMQLVAVISLATDELTNLLSSPSKLLPILRADSEAVDAIDIQYKAEKSRLLLGQQYEEAALARDQNKKKKKGFNYISSIEIIVNNGSFSSIDISIEGQIITVEFDYESYAVISFMKVLVDLGGTYLHGGVLPKSWLKLKPWHKYKWYNRPRR